VILARFTLDRPRRSTAYCWKLRLKCMHAHRARCRSGSALRITHRRTSSLISGEWSRGGKRNHFLDILYSRKYSKLKACFNAFLLKARERYRRDLSACVKAINVSQWLGSFCTAEWLSLSVNRIRTVPRSPTSSFLTTNCSKYYWRGADPRAASSQLALIKES